MFHIHHDLPKTLAAVDPEIQKQGGGFIDQSTPFHLFPLITYNLNDLPPLKSSQEI